MQELTMNEPSNDYLHGAKLCEVLLAGLEEGILAADREDRVFFFNPAVAVLLGRDPSQLMRADLYDTLKPLKENGEVFPKEEFPPVLVRKGANAARVTVFYAREDGARFPMTVASAPLQIAGEALGTVTVLHNIIAEYEAARGKDMIMGMIAHQFRTPLTTLRWFLEPQASGGDANAEVMVPRDFLSMLSRSTEHMINLLDTILNVVRMESGEFRMYPERVNVESFVRKLCEEAMLLKEKTQRFTWAVNTPPALEMVQDSHLLREVVYNLLANAFRYTPADGEIAFSAVRQNGEILFSVKDTGYGIPKRDHHRIFERMFRASNVKQKFPGGTGFGLYLAKLFVERSRGRIWFESEENKGTTFYVALPLEAQQ